MLSKSYSGRMISYTQDCRKLSPEKHLGHPGWKNVLFKSANMYLMLYSALLLRTKQSLSSGSSRCRLVQWMRIWVLESDRTESDFSSAVDMLYMLGEFIQPEN